MLSKQVPGTVLTGRGRVLPAVALSLLIAGCGSGDSTAPAGQAGLAVSGPIEGFGSVIVNGIRFDDSQSSVSSDSGNALSSDDLRLGMVVQIRGAGAGEQRVARSIVTRSELYGFVQAVGSDTLLVNGITVTTGPATIWDIDGAIAPGVLVEVYGHFDPVNQQITATRVETKSGGVFRLRGTVSSWNIAATTFVINGVEVNYGSLALPNGFADGDQVRVDLASAPAGGAATATRVYRDDDLSDDDNTEVSIEGLIASTGSATDFVVNGISVNAAAARFDDGVVSDLVVGRRVEVEGRFSSGVLMAREVEFEDGESSGDFGGVEVEGPVTAITAVDEFVVRNTLIRTAASTVFEDGSPASLAEGVCVEVHGNLQTSAGKTAIAATRVEVKIRCED